jgi:hypothetical protein
VAWCTRDGRAERPCAHDMVQGWLAGCAVRPRTLCTLASGPAASGVQGMPAARISLSTPRLSFTGVGAPWKVSSYANHVRLATPARACARQTALKIADLGHLAEGLDVHLKWWVGARTSRGGAGQGAAGWSALSASSTVYIYNKLHA